MRCRWSQGRPRRAADVPDSPGKGGVEGHAERRGFNPGGGHVSDLSSLSRGMDAGSGRPGDGRRAGDEHTNVLAVLHVYPSKGIKAGPL